VDVALNYLVNEGQEPMDPATESDKIAMPIVFGIQVRWGGGTAKN
jgi:hypothetical protein